MTAFVIELLEQSHKDTIASVCVSTCILALESFLEAAVRQQSTFPISPTRDQMNLVPTERIFCPRISVLRSLLYDHGTPKQESKRQLANW
jgi:hypothetical protein